MSDCDNDLNSQLKALHARLDRIDDDLIAHFAAQFLQAIAFLANPLTVAQGAIMTAQFASRSAFKALVKQLPGYEELKMLQHLDSAALIEGLEATLVAQAESMIELAATKAAAAVDAEIEAARNYILAIEEGAIAAIVDPLLVTFNEVTETLNKANATVGAIKAFIDTLTKTASCKIEDSVVGTRPPASVDLVNTPASISSNITPAE